MSRRGQVAAHAGGGGAISVVARAWQRSPPRAKAAVGLWLVGVLACYGARGYEPSAAAKEAYAEQMARLDAPAFVDEYMAVTSNYEAARIDLEAVKVWFWRFRTPYSSLVPPAQREHDAALRDLRGMRKREAAIVSAAKRELGIFSTDGVTESRNAFWQSFEKGKVFAQRQTFWDAVNTVLYSRQEESWVGFAIKWMFTIAINFTLGMLGAAIYFAFALWGVVTSYDPNVVTGMLFYVVALFSALSMILFALVALYGTATGGAYVVLRTAIKQQSLEYQQRHARLRAAQRGGRRPHYQ
eukprot:PRCOL_00004279-RA